MNIPDEQFYLEQFTCFLSQRVASAASQMDRDSDVLQAVFDDFKRQCGLTIRIPYQEGGKFLSDQGFIKFRIQLARYCGALSFLQAQHQVAVTWLTQSPNQNQIRHWYHAILQQDTALGIGFISPRRKSFDVQQAGAAYTLSGEIPWVTGYGFLQHIVTSFHKDGHRHFFLLPFASSSQASGRVSYSEPLPLIVFNALNTVQARLDNWQVHRDEIFLSIPVDTGRAPERHNSIYTLAGASQGLQDQVNLISDLPAGMTMASKCLGQRLDSYMRKIMVEGNSPSALRAEGSQLAQDWAALARWAYGGKALMLDHPVNRLSREIWQYCIAGLRPPEDLDAIYPSGHVSNP